MSAPNWTPVTVSLGALKPWAANPRLSTKAQAKRILASFAKFGQVLPVAIGPDNEVYDGHQRLSALLTVHGADYEIDARRSSRPLTDDERRALVVTLHAGAVGAWNWDDLAGWDAATLGEWGMDAQALKQWNTDAAALAAMLEAEKPAPVDAEPQIDRAEELRAKWGVEPGQLWKLGEHRLICGDCTDKAVVERVIGGDMVGAVVTDPPYGVDIAGWDVAPSIEFINSVLEITSGPVAMFGGASVKSLKAFVEYGAERCLVWAPDFSLAKTSSNHMFFRWHPIWCWNLPDEVLGIPFDVLKDITDGHNFWNHCSTKPTALIEKLVNGMTIPEDAVYEPFCGSGTAIIACERLGRRCRAVEISPAYVAVALERWAQATGGTPELVEA